MRFGKKFKQIFRCRFGMDVKNVEMLWNRWCCVMFFIQNFNGQLQFLGGKFAAIVVIYKSVLLQ